MASVQDLVLGRRVGAHDTNACLRCRARRQKQGPALTPRNNRLSNGRAMLPTQTSDVFYGRSLIVKIKENWQAI